MKALLILACVISASYNSVHTQPSSPLPFKKVIIWGHKLHSHTHSYIHYAFYRTFTHLGYDTLWLDNNDNVSSIDFSECLFLTAGGVDQLMPVRSDCRYILHNCAPERYKALFAQNACIILQVYSHDCLKRNEEKIDSCMYINRETKTIYMPWATDLLPHEIDTIKSQMPSREKSNTIYWVGSVWDGIHGNRNYINDFKTACRENNIMLQEVAAVDQNQNIDLIGKSYMAPAIQGQWQCENGYIPCRIFKNISYGQMGITNSKTVYDLFEGKIIYYPDSYQLFYHAQEQLQHTTLQELYDLMDLVKNKHTYINRIDHILDFLHSFKPLSLYYAPKMIFKLEDGI